MDIKLKNFKINIIKTVSLLLSLVFCFISSYGLFGNLTKKAFYNCSVNNVTDSVAFCKTFNQDLIDIIQLCDYSEFSGYKTFDEFSKNSEKAEIIKMHYSQKEKKALDLFEEIENFKKICPVDVDNLDLEECSYYEYNEESEKLFKFDENTKISLEKWRSHYSYLRNQIFELANDCTSKETISAEINGKLNAELANEYANAKSETEYLEKTFNEKKNLKILILKDGKTEYSNTNENPAEFINNLKNNAMYSLSYKNGKFSNELPSYKVKKNLINKIADDLFNFSEMYDITTENIRSSLTDEYELYIKVDNIIECDDSYKTIAVNINSKPLNMSVTTVFAVLSLLTFICFVILSNIKYDKNSKLNIFDKIPFVFVILFTLFVFIDCGVGTALIIQNITDINYFWEQGLSFFLLPETVNTLCGIFSLISLLVVALFIKYLIKNIKAKSLKNRILSFRIIRKTKQLTAEFFNTTRKRKEYVIILTAFFAALFFINLFLCFLTTSETDFLLPFLIFNLIICGIGVKFSLDLLILKSFAKEICDGTNPPPLNESKIILPLRSFAKDLNGCLNAIKSSAEEAVKNERTKTELITNVSHDLKTPLTSIINYTGLLKSENISDEEKAEYLNILEEKSKKLGRLIEDLTDASKAVSGNIKVELTTVNLNELALQAVGENSDQLENAGLDLKLTEKDKNIFVKCNPRSTLRILDNLFSNAKKYSLPDSRVYADVYRDGNYGVFTLKNISRYELNISPEELTERFVRGDKSRTSDGSGLGLSIAQSFAEIQGGRFNIEIDGDLFKAILKLPIG